MLADESHPAFGMGMFHRLPQTMDSLKRMPESFRTGIGHNYDSHGPDGAIGFERSLEPWNNANLIPLVLPAVGVIDTLRAGATVADVGTGAGGAVLRMAAMGWAKAASRAADECQRRRDFDWTSVRNDGRASSRARST